MRLLVRGHEPRNEGASRSRKRQGHRLTLRASKGNSPGDTVTLVRYPFRTSDHQNCKVVHLCCLKPLSCGNWFQQPQELVASLLETLPEHLLCLRRSARSQRYDGSQRRSSGSSGCECRTGGPATPVGWREGEGGPLGQQTKGRTGLGGEKHLLREGRAMSRALQ